jgi:hypothetical protein
VTGFLSAIRHLILCFLLLPAIARPQSGPSPSAVTPASFERDLFESEELLQIKIAGNIREVINDRGQNPQYHAFTLSYLTKDSSEISIPVKLRARGHFRKDRTNCFYPPLMINFSKKLSSSSIFQGQDKLKLVMPCRGDEYIIREYLVYKLYNLITPKSFRARLVRVVMDDVIKKKQTSFYGMLLEDEEQMAARNNVVVIKQKLLNPRNTENNEFLKMAVFEYMIGNTDWSIQYLQNIHLVAKDTLAAAIAVPYDFDHAGVVNAPYAKPAEELQMRSVKERRYRGYCVTDMKKFEAVTILFNQLRKDFYGVYTNCALLDDKYIKMVTSYLDDFYDIINQPKALHAAFSYPCDKSGTGDVIIKGLRND